MKIKNDLVTLKTGDKQYNFNNLILDEYLNRFVRAQLDKENISEYKNDKLLRVCLLKFDTPFEKIESDSKIKNQDFDICLMLSKREQIVSNNQIVIEYSYGDAGIYDYKESAYKTESIDKYYGKKITAIGFNVTWVPYNLNNEGTYKFPVCAILDTSNYNIYLQKNQELSITRRDIITTDALFYSNDNNKIPGPAHLCPKGLTKIIQDDIYNENNLKVTFFNDNAYGILHSVGLSSYPDYIDKEFIIGEDIQVEQSETELNIKGIENYLSTDNPLFCSETIYCNNNLHPVKTNYKYIVLKYKIYQEVHSGTSDNITSEVVDTGYYYYQAIPIDKIGKSNLKIKYERG